MSNTYEEIASITHEEAERVALDAQGSGDTSGLVRAIIALALNDSDRDWTTEFCLRHVEHIDVDVRGSAMTGLGHLARRFKSFSDITQIEAVLKRALTDTNATVRGHADDAADEVEQFAGGRVRESS
jgi:hypothetical protein